MRREILVSIVYIHPHLRVMLTGQPKQKNRLSLYLHPPQSSLSSQSLNLPSPPYPSWRLLPQRHKTPLFCL